MSGAANRKPMPPSKTSRSTAVSSALNGPSPYAPISAISPTAISLTCASTSAPTAKASKPLRSTYRPGRTPAFSSSHKFAEPGSHIVEVAIDADGLKADNSVSRAIPVIDTLPVLLIDGDSGREFKSETAFLDFALRPFTASRGELKDMIAPKVIQPAAFTTEEADANRVVILANVERLGDDQTKVLDEFVKNGGGLLVFPGDKLDSNWYNKILHKNGRGPLPMKIGPLNSNPVESEPVSLVSRHYRHAALEIFNDPRNGTLSGATVSHWYKLLPSQASAVENESASTFASLDNGDPFLAGKNYGKGRVILCSTAADSDWSNIPMRPFYLPLMQQLTTWLASGVHPPRNINVGENLTVIRPPAEAGQAATLTDPLGKTHQLPLKAVGGRSVAHFEETLAPGIYLVKLPDDSINHYVVNTARTESNLERLSDSEIRNLARDMDAALVSDFEEYRQTDQSRRFGQEIWVLLLWVVLIAAFGELFLIQYFTEKRA